MDTHNRKRIVLASITGATLLTTALTLLGANADQGPVPSRQAASVPAELVSPCSGTITRAVSVGTVRMCDPVTVTTRTAPSCPVCPGGLNVVFQMEPYMPVEDSWIVGEAGGALDQMREYQHPGGPRIQVAVTEFGIVVAGGGYRRTLLDLTENLGLARHFFQGRGGNGYGYGTEADEPIKVLKKARGNDPLTKPCEYDISFAITCNDPDDSGCVSGQRWIQTAAARFRAEGITVMEDCAGRTHTTWGECRSNERELATTPDLYSQYPKRMLQSMVKRLFDEATGQQPLKEQTLTEFLPPGLAYVPGSASEPPAQVSVAPDRTTLHWAWQLAGASEAHTVTFRALPLQEGQWPISGTLGIVDPRRLQRQVPMQPVTVTVAGLCETPTPPATPSATELPTPTASPTTIRATPATPTPTPVPTATPTRVPRPVYLPVGLSEQCVPGQKPIDVALVIDASTSMTESTGRGTKLDAARAAARAFLDQVHLDAGDQAAIIAFNADVSVLAELTSDRAALLGALDRIEVAPQTRIHLGVQAAQTVLTGARRRAENAAAMVVLTDGRANPESPQLAVDAAGRAKAAGITMFTIGLGAELDFLALERMASQPGYFYQTLDAGGLEEIYRQIAVAIPCSAERFWGRR
jgi:Mg-chelatase subunit ChlD